MRLDLADETAWLADEVLHLTPKAFAVLRHLAAHRERLVTKAELLAAVWSEAAVSDGVLTTVVREIRRALGENPRAPAFIQTVHRRGYRFIGDIDRTESPPARDRMVVGRESELADLQTWLKAAQDGKRQLVFVTGEPGIGKTALVDAFLAAAVDANAVWVGRGQSIDCHGAGEAYMPVLEALGRLCRAAGGIRLREQLRRFAPSWLTQMPALLTPAEARALHAHASGATPDRMIRELAEAFDVITADRPLVLWLEDVHWSDASSLTLVSALARRPDPARLFIIATYRPVDALAGSHALTDLVRELGAHGLCRSLSLGELVASAVPAYLGARFPTNGFPRALAPMLHRRTEGHPLFLVGMVDDLVARGTIAEVEREWTLRTDLDLLGDAVPDSMRDLVALQQERLSSVEHEALAAASLVGSTFAAPLVAAALGRSVAEVEDLCARLADRRLFLRSDALSAWPDGTLAARYAFLHAVYQTLWRERVGASARPAWHARIAERLETAYGERVGDIAAELATHFEAARHYAKAIRHGRRASANAMRRGAPQEAVLLARRGLALLEMVPDADERAELERELRIALGPPLQTTTSHGAPEVFANYSRLRELCRDRGDDPRLFPALVGLVRWHSNRAEFETARELGEQVFRIAQASPERRLASAHALLGVVRFNLGELTLADEHLVSALQLHDRQRSETLARLYGDTVELPTLGYRAIVLWHLGYPEQALKTSHDALKAARDLGLPAPLAFALALAAWLHRLRREPAITHELATELRALATEQGFPFWIAQSTFELGWALAARDQHPDGAALMREGLARYRATGGELAYVGNVIAQTEVELSDDRADRAAACAAIADTLTLIARTGQRCHLPSLYCLMAELNDGEAETWFHRAIDAAAAARAKLPELRAVLGLARRWRSQGQVAAARELLAPRYAWFAEGFDTADLRDARELLQTLSADGR